MRCLDCHYSLVNLTEHRCPECGRRFDPANNQTFETEEESARESKRKSYRWMLLGLLGTAAILWLCQWIFHLELLAFAITTILIAVVLLALRLLRTAPVN